jgi:hypothetical protein
MIMASLMLILMKKSTQMIRVFQVGQLRGLIGTRKRANFRSSTKGLHEPQTTVRMLEMK